MLLRTLLALVIAMSTSHLFAQMPPVEPGVSHELATWRAARYSNVRYKLDLTLEKMSPVLKGTIEVRVAVSPAGRAGSPRSGAQEPPASAGGPDVIVLDWRKIKGSESLSTIANVTVNGLGAKLSSGPPPADAGGSDLLYSEANEHLIFRDGVVAGENVIKLDFTSPILTSGSAITRYVDKEDGAEYIYSLFVPSDASTAFPVFDQPDLKARFGLTVDAPLGWDVISNAAKNPLVISGKSGHHLGVFPNGTMHFFANTKPISSYVFAFAAGEFQEFTEISQTVAHQQLVKEAKTTRVGENEFVLDDEVRSKTGTHLFVRKSQAEKFKPHAAEVFRLNREGVKYLEEYFDYKFPFPKYDLVLIPEFPFGGMEHAGATFLREDRIIFPQEPTKNDYITRANVIFHEAAHQWFGDTVTMKWFDDLWLKEGFAEFMAYKTLEKVMPEYNAWKIFYERNKQFAYLTDSTKGTTPIYREIANLSAAKSAYGNIVYRKAPSFLKQAEYYLGSDKFQAAVRAFLKKHEYGNAGWEDLVNQFELASGTGLQEWASVWVKQPGLPRFRTKVVGRMAVIEQEGNWEQRFKLLAVTAGNRTDISEADFSYDRTHPRIDLRWLTNRDVVVGKDERQAVIANYQDYGYGIFLLDAKSRDYVLKNIQNEKDDFLRTMMWGNLWDSVREGELDPKIYVELVIKNLQASQSMRAPASVRPPPSGKPPIYPETDESTIATLLGRVGTAMNYYIGDEQRREIAPRLEEELRDIVLSSFMPEREQLTVFRYWLNLASTERSRLNLKSILQVSMIKAGISKQKLPDSPSESPSQNQLIEIPPLRTKDRFDIVSKLLILGDPDAEGLLAELEKAETSDEAKRYAYAARAGIGSAGNKAKFWNDYTANKDVSESWIESSLPAFNAPGQAELTLPYLERALAELPRLKRDRKIFFVNSWLAAFISGQKSEQSLAIVNKFLADNPNLDNDLRLKILENVDLIERAVKIRARYAK